MNELKHFEFTIGERNLFITIAATLEEALVKAQLLANGQPIELKGSYTAMEILSGKNTNR